MAAAATSARRSQRGPGPLATAAVFKMRTLGGSPDPPATDSARRSRASSTRASFASYHGSTPSHREQTSHNRCRWPFGVGRRPTLFFLYMKTINQAARAVPVIAETDVLVVGS